MSFQLSTDVDKNKIFLINCSSLNERLDPEYYQPNHYQDLILLKNSPYRNDVLDHVCNRIVDGPFGSSIKASDYVESGIPFIRVADVTRGEGSIKTDDLIFISEEAHERIIRSKVIPNDVVIAKTGATMGAASLVPDSIPEANIRGDLAALSVNEDHCIPRYIVAYINTNIGQRLFWRLDSGGTRGRVVIGNLKKYPIVVPPIEIQQKIIETMDAGYALQKQKELEAQRSLDSIDDYLLDELGINLPEAEENTLQNRIFYRKFNDISGNRFDCNYNSKINLILSQNGKYKIVYLKNLLVTSPQYGANEIAIDKNSATEVTYIRITDIDDFGYLKKDGLKTASTIEEQYILKKNDLLFARSGSVGRCYLHQDDTHKSIFAGYLIRFVINTEIANPYYVFYYCHSKIYKMWVDAISRSAVQSNINSEEYKSLPIFLPPIDKQIEIVEHINAIRDRAKQLRQEAAADLEKAKQEVEAMILGVE